MNRATSIPATPGSSSRPLDRRDILVAAAVAVAATLFHLLYFNHGVRNWVDLGVAAADAERILGGDVFGRDFMAPYGPGRYYLTALWFSLFGTSLFALNCLFLCLMTVVDVLTYLLARRFVARPYALAAALLAAAAHGPIHKVYIGLFSVLFLWAACRAIERRTFGAGAVMGLAAALAVLFRYDVGAIAVCCGFALVVLSAPRVTGGEGFGALKPAAAGFAGGGLALAVPVGAAFFVWADPGWIIGHILQRIEAFDYVRVDEPGLVELVSSGRAGNILEAALPVLFLATPFVVTAIGAYDALVRRRGAPAILLLVLGLMGVFLLNQWRLIPRFLRLMQAGPVLYVGMVLIADRLRGLSARRPRLGAAAASCAVAALLCAMAVFVWTRTGTASQDSVAVLRHEESYMELERARCWVAKKRGEKMDTVVGVVKRFTVDGEPILAGPACPILYFFSERPNPTPYSDPYLYFLNPDAQQRVIDAVEAAGVNVYVEWTFQARVDAGPRGAGGRGAVDQPRPIVGLSLDNAAPILHDYVTRTFVMREHVGPFTVMRR